eukprot:COSAG02_NODE_135_length_34565_cov_80.368856_1_plen_119_part_00
MGAENCVAKRTGRSGPGSSRCAPLQDKRACTEDQLQFRGRNICTAAAGGALLPRAYGYMAPNDSSDDANMAWNHGSILPPFTCDPITTRPAGQPSRTPNRSTGAMARSNRSTARTYLA